MIEFVVAAMMAQGIASAVPETVTCDVRFTLRETGAFRARATCPDVPNRDWIEAESVEQVLSAQPRRGDLQRNRVEGQVSFTSYEVDGNTYWRVLPGVIAEQPIIYPTPARRSRLRAACTARFDIIDGLPQNLCSACNADDIHGHFLLETQRTVFRSHYVRSDEPIEIIREIEFTPRNMDPLAFPEAPDCQADGDDAAP